MLVEYINDLSDRNVPGLFIASVCCQWKIYGHFKINLFGNILDDLLNVYKQISKYENNARKKNGHV